MNYWDEDVYALVGRKVQKENRVVAYCRMNRNNKDSRAKMLEQKRAIKQWTQARGITVDQTIEDWHTGVDYGVGQRPGFHEILQLLMANKLDAVVIEAEDRLSRVAIDVFYELFKYYGAHLLVVNRGITDPYYQSEQSEDIARLLEKAKVSRVRQD